MKTRFLSCIALLSIAASAFAGQIGPYSWTYNATPVNAPVTAINPPPGSVVVDTTTGVHYRKISAVGDNSSYAVEAVQLVSTATPLTGATVTASDSQSDETVVITPAGTIAALTFVFPSNTNSRIGQQITLQSSQIVTTLTLTKGGQTITDPAGTALAANVPQRWIKTAASTWVRISNVATDSGVVLTASVITNGLTASGSASNDFSSSTGTFKTSTGLTTISGPAALSTATLSGAGAVSIVKGVTKLTTTGASQALSLANGTDGQVISIVHDVDGGSAILTPTTATGYTTITFTAVGETATLMYVTTRGWVIISLRGAVAA